MWINDDNTLEYVTGVIACLQADLDERTPEFPLEPGFDELLQRIDLKLRQNTNQIRWNWFLTAREHAEAARTAFREGRKVEADQSLSKCCEYLEQGNKAHRRKTSFIVSADGIATPLNSSSIKSQQSKPGA
jgi:hypothetical protein